MKPMAKRLASLTLAVCLLGSTAVLPAGAAPWSQPAGGVLETLLDVVWFLHNAYFPGDVRVENSGRYDNIYLNERAPDRLYWMD